MGKHLYPSSRADFFRGEIAASEHIVEIYDESDAFLDSLEGFVVGGLERSDTVILILTRGHLYALEERIKKHGFDLPALQTEQRYIPLFASDVLEQLMFRGWPEEKLFMQTIAPLIERAKKNTGRVRVFGEMVAILWAEGQYGATVRMEHLWHDLCQSEGLIVFCAYPNSGFNENAGTTMKTICDSHTKVYSDH